MGKVNLSTTVADYLESIEGLDSSPKESLRRFFEENNLLSSRLKDISKDIKSDLIFTMVWDRLFDYQFGYLLSVLDEGNLLVSEKVVWSKIEKYLDIKIKDWVRELNPLFDLRIGFMDNTHIPYISLVVGTIEEGVVSLPDVLTLICPQCNKNYSGFLCVRDGKYIVIIPKDLEYFMRLSSTDGSFDRYSLKSCWEHRADLIAEMGITGIKYSDLGFNYRGAMSYEDYESSEEKQTAIDKTIVAQEDTFLFGLICLMGKWGEKFLKLMFLYI